MATIKDLEQFNSMVSTFNGGLNDAAKIRLHKLYKRALFESMKEHLDQGSKIFRSDEDGTTEFLSVFINPCAKDEDSIYMCVAIDYTTKEPYLFELNEDFTELYISHPSIKNESGYEKFELDILNQKK